MQEDFFNLRRVCLHPHRARRDVERLRLSLVANSTLFIILTRTTDGHRIRLRRDDAYANLMQF